MVMKLPGAVLCFLGAAPGGFMKWLNNRIHEGGANSLFGKI